MESNLQKRIIATEELLNYQKNIGGTSLTAEQMLIIENQLAIMKELKEIRLDTKVILGNTCRI